MSVKFDHYKVTIKFVDKLVGGIPIVPEGTDRADAFEGWARGQGVEEPDARELAEKLAADTEIPTAAEQIEGLETGFRRDAGGLYIEARQVKAMLREAAQRLGLIQSIRGVRQVMQHDLHVRALDGSQKLHLDRAEADGKDMRPISVVTRQGPRTALKRFEYVTQAELSFVVRVLSGGVAKKKDGSGLIGEEELRDMLDFGCDLGLGADRSQGEGTFEVVSLEPVA